MNVRTCFSHLIRLSIVSRNLNKNADRFYTRWAHRRPARVIIPETTEGIKRIEPQNLDDIIELQDYEIDEQKPPQTKKKNWAKNVQKTTAMFDIDELDRKTHFKSKIDTSTKKQKNSTEVNYTKNEILKTTFDHNGDYVYSKMQSNDSIIG